MRFLKMVERKKEADAKRHTFQAPSVIASMNKTFDKQLSPNKTEEKDEECKGEGEGGMFKAREREIEDDTEERDVLL